MKIRRWMTYGAVAVAAVALSCTSLQVLAPPVDETMRAAAGVEDASGLREGRRIYVERCGECHALERIDEYTPADWRRILPEMADKAHLDGDQRSSLRQYIEAVDQARRQRSGGEAAL